jgi:hypothetical protein
LANFVLPTKVTTIVDNAFEDCLALQSANLAPAASVLVTVGDTVFKGCSSLDSVQLPDSLQVLKSGTFMNCTGLETIVFPESVVSMGNSTFKDCTTLQNITFSTVLESLGHRTFTGCTSLVQVLFPETMTVIGTETFLDTTNVLTLRMRRGIWDSVVATLPEGAKRQLVTFYQDSNTVYSRTLVIQRDHYAFDQVGGTNANLSNTTLLLLGKGELTQSQVNAAIDEHTYRFATPMLSTLRVGGDIESLGVSAISSTTGLKESDSIWEVK